MKNSQSSGGIPAVLSTLKHASKQTGFIRAAKALSSMNSVSGFDCPGCAWPEPEHRARFEFCENGAKALMSATTTRVVDKKFWESHAIADLKKLPEHELEALGRLVTPALRLPHSKHFEAISYQKAGDILAEHFKKLDDANQAVFYTSGRASNEAAFLFQLMARRLGTNNLCDCSNLCHESSGVALKKTIGTGKGTVQISDFIEAQVIFLIGHNPSTNHPRMLSTLREARLKGAKIVVINPLLEPGLLSFRHPQELGDIIGPAKDLASHYFQLNVGGDLALFYALLQNLVDKQCLDHEFISQYTSGFDELESSLKIIDQELLLKQAGLSRKELLTLTKLIAEHDRIIYAWGMGITQTTYGVATIEAITSLSLLRGHLGKEGAGLCPVRGHSNVQGNRTVGINHAPSAAFLIKLKDRFGFMPPTTPGLDVVDSLKAMIAGHVKVFLALGGNFLSASPDLLASEQALAQCDLKMSFATKLNKTHLADGGISIVLPVLTRVEQDVQAQKEQVSSVENSMSIVHASRGHFKPIRPELYSEAALICELAHKSLPALAGLDWLKLKDSYELIRDHIGACVEELADYNNKLSRPGGFLIENPVRKRIFMTHNRRANFTKVQALPAPIEGDLVLTTIRSHDQFNTAIYGLNDRYRGITGQRDIVFMNDFDIKRLKLKANMRVDLISRFNHIERIAPNFQIKAFNIKQGSAAAYFPEANVLIALDSVAHESNTPTSKLIPIWIRRRESSSSSGHSA